MLSVERRRPFGSAEPPRVEPFPASQDKGSQPIAAPLSACPITNRRPADLAQFQAAYAAADGRPVVEHAAAAVVPGMTVWQLGRWLPVANIWRDGNSVEVVFAAGAATSVRHLSHDAPVYVLERP